MSGTAILGSLSTSRSFASNFNINVSEGTNVYLAPMVINVRAFSLKPNTRVYVFFDNTPVSNLCTPCNNSITDSFSPTGVEGANLVTSSNGTITFTLRVPRNTFYYRTSFIRILDVSSVTAENIINSTTGALATFYGSSLVTAEVAASGTRQLSTATDLNVVSSSVVSGLAEAATPSLPAGTDPYYFNLSKVNNIKTNSATIYIGGFEIDEL
jgi:hypothetical protein